MALLAVWTGGGELCSHPQHDTCWSCASHGPVTECYCICLSGQPAFWLVKLRYYCSYRIKAFDIMIIQDIVVLTLNASF